MLARSLSATAVAAFWDELEKAASDQHHSDVGAFAAGAGVLGAGALLGHHFGGAGKAVASAGKAATTSAGKTVAKAATPSVGKTVAKAGKAVEEVAAAAPPPVMKVVEHPKSVNQIRYGDWVPPGHPGRSHLDAEKKRLAALNKKLPADKDITTKATSGSTIVPRDVHGSTMIPAEDTFHFGDTGAHANRGGGTAPMLRKKAS